MVCGSESCVSVDAVFLGSCAHLGKVVGPSECQDNDAVVAAVETMLSRAFCWPGHALLPLILTAVPWGLEVLKTASLLLPSVWGRGSLPVHLGPVLWITLPDSLLICKLIATLRRGWKFKIGVPAWLVPLRALFLAGGRPTIFSLCPVEERKKGLWRLFLL